MRRVLICVLSALAMPAQPQDMELGARYWYSVSNTTRSHNAQILAPGLGNPTSILTYEELNTHAIELHARKRLGPGWVRGNAGLGSIRRGSFDDEDFLAGQVKFSDSTSAVKGNQLTYATLDLGQDFWQLPNGVAGLFMGYHFWSERLDAYGAVFTVGGGTIPESVLVITNEVTWHSLRLGLAAAWQLGPRMRLSVDAAWVPYARVRDEDSHWLRQDPSDLGPAPNIFIEGRGRGLQLDLEVRYRLDDAWEGAAGVRHWWLRAQNGNREAVGISVPLVELESQRTGLTLSLTRKW